MILDKYGRKSVFLGFSLCFILLIVGCTSLAIRRCSLGSLSVCNIEDKTQIKKIADFDKTDFTNLGGGLNETLVIGSSEIQQEYVKDGANEPNGVAINIEYKVKEKESVSWLANLKNVDVSAAEAISFWFKFDKERPQAQIYLIVTDNKENYNAVLLDEYLSAGEKGVWQEIILPVSNYESVDFNDLSSIEFQFHAGEEMRQESVLIDNIAFVGGPQLHFESIKDNLLGFPDSLQLKKAQHLAEMQDREMLKTIAEDTWLYFRDIVDKRTHLPLDWIKTGDKPVIGDYTSPTNIGMYLLSCTGAVKMGFITEDEAKQRLLATLKSLENLERVKGFHYNFYNTSSGIPTSTFISAVDCGWLAASLIAIREGWSGEIQSMADRLLEEMDFSLFYDEQVGQMRVGYNADEKKLTDYHYGLICTEARIASIVAIAKGDVPVNHWFSMYRTLPEEWKWQSQKPRGEKKGYKYGTVFEGFYVYQRRKIVPSWGGSLFEFLMPNLVFDEQENAPDSFGKNNRIAAEIHAEYARRKQYPVWGLSPCSVPKAKYGEYTEFGIRRIGVKGYPDRKVVTPHVGFLALNVIPDAAISNIRNFLTKYDMYSKYGLSDSVLIDEEVASKKFLALDQGMSFVSLVNYLEDGYIQKLFKKNDGVNKFSAIIREEKFNL